MKRLLTLIFILILVVCSSLVYSDELRRGMAESEDDGQESTGWSAGSVNTSHGYVELMYNWFCKRWGGALRFPDVTIPQGATINSAYIQVISYSTCWLHAYDSVACENVDSALSIESGGGTYDLSERWADRTDAFLVWNENMRPSSIYPDSTPDVKTLLQEIVDRGGWKSGNAVIFLFKNIYEEGIDSSAYEIYSWDIVTGGHAYGGSLFVDYTLGSAVPDEDSLLLRPTDFILDQNYPNPFNLKTNITYSLPTASKIKVIIYDLLGKRVRTLIDEYQTPGYKSFDWDATDDKGNVVSSGIYLYRIHAGEFTDTKKMILMK